MTMRALILSAQACGLMAVCMAQPVSEKKTLKNCLGSWAVYVDFTARWCAICLTNKKYGYSGKVNALFRKGNVLLWCADATRPHADIEEELAVLKRDSLPVNVLYMLGREPAITHELFTSSYLEGFLRRHWFGETLSGQAAAR